MFQYKFKMEESIPLEKQSLVFSSVIYLFWEQTTSHLERFKFPTESVPLAISM